MIFEVFQLAVTILSRANMLSYFEFLYDRTARIEIVQSFVYCFVPFLYESLGIEVCPSTRIVGSSSRYVQSRENTEEAVDKAFQCAAEVVIFKR